MPATTADVAEVVLTKEDVPDPTLQSRQPDELKVPELVSLSGCFPYWTQALVCPVYEGIHPKQFRIMCDWPRANLAVIKKDTSVLFQLVVVYHHQHQG